MNVYHHAVVLKHGRKFFWYSYRKVVIYVPLIESEQTCKFLTNRECGQREMIGPRASQKGIYVTAHVIKGHATSSLFVGTLSFLDPWAPGKKVN